MQTIADPRMNRRKRDINMIAAEARRVDNGKTLASETVQKIVAFKLSHPLASQGLIGEMVGVTHETVSRALATPYAKATLDLTKDVVSTYAEKLRALQGDSVEYWAKSIERGHKELQSDSPSAPVLTNARECTVNVSKVTGLLKEQVHVRTQLTRDGDYNDIQALATDPAIVAFLSHDGEGESDPTGVAGGEGDPASSTADP